MAWTIDGRTMKATGQELVPPFERIKVVRLAYTKTNGVAQTAGNKVVINEGTVALVDTNVMGFAVSGDQIELALAAPKWYKDLNVVVTGTPGTFEVVVEFE